MSGSLQGRAAMAFSLNNYRAAKPADFADAAAQCAHLIRAALAGDHGSRPRQHMAGNVVNVNLPFLRDVPPEGYYLAHMSTASVMMRFGAADLHRRALALQHRGIADGDNVRVMVAQAPQYQKCGALFIQLCAPSHTTVLTMHYVCPCPF